MCHTAAKRQVLAGLLALFLCLAAGAISEGLEVVIMESLEDFDIAYIRDGALVTNFNHPNSRGVIARYTMADLGESPRKVRCRARFEGGGAVAVVVGPEGDSLAGITGRSIHAVFAADSYHLGIYEDGVLTDRLADAYTLDLTGETEYTFGFDVSGAGLTLLLPTGEKVKLWDERLKSAIGSQVVFEHYLTAEDVQNWAAPAITYVYAKGSARAALEDDFQRGDGLPLEAPSGHVYTQFRNESAP